MAQQTTKQQHRDDDVHVVAQLIKGTTHALALSIEAPLHRNFGSGYVGCGLFSFVFMFLFALFFPGQSCIPMQVFAGVFGAFWVIGTVNVIIRWWRATENTHSCYNGTPHLWCLLPFWNEIYVKYLESLLVIVLGLAIRFFNHALGDYLILAGVVALVRNYKVALFQRHQAVGLNDAVIEQKVIADQFREMQQD